MAAERLARDGIAPCLKGPFHPFLSVQLSFVKRVCVYIYIYARRVRSREKKRERDREIFDEEEKRRGEIPMALTESSIETRSPSISTNIFRSVLLNDSKRLCYYRLGENGKLRFVDFLKRRLVSRGEGGIG